MARVIYDKSSPYYGTPQTSWYLAPMTFRSIAPEVNDRYVLISPQYENRPDKLSYDLYGSPKYWWTFMARNMDIIRDPIWDLKSGIAIYVPTLARIEKLIG